MYVNSLQCAIEIRKALIEEQIVETFYIFRATLETRKCEENCCHIDVYICIYIQRRRVQLSE